MQSRIIYAIHVVYRCVASYEDNDVKKPLILLGSGNEGLSALKEMLKSDIVAYGLLRVVSWNFYYIYSYIKVVIIVVFWLDGCCR